MAFVATLVLAASCGNSKNAEVAQDSMEQAGDVVGSVVEIEEVEIDEIPDSVTAPAAAEATSLIDKIKNAANPEAIKEGVTKGIAYVQNLVKSGKLTEAKGYLEQLKPYAEKVNMGSAIEKLENAIGIADKAESAKGAVQNVADKATEAQAQAADVKAKAGAAVDALKGLGK